MHPIGVPKFPTLVEHHEGVSWENVLPYFLTKGSPYREHDICEGCNKVLRFGQARVNVKVIEKEISLRIHRELFGVEKKLDWNRNTSYFPSVIPWNV